MHLFDVLCYKANQIIRERKRYAHYHINLQIEKSDFFPEILRLNFLFLSTVDKFAIWSYLWFMSWLVLDEVRCKVAKVDCLLVQNALL